MDDRQRVIDWLLEHADFLQLKVKAYDWSDIIGKPVNLYDCKSEITLDNKKYEGRGTGKTEEIAFLKSIGEALDRYLFFQSDANTTNGFAIHLTSEKAKENAINELIERDRFFCHFLTKSPFYETDLKISDLQIDSSIFDFLNKNQIHFQLSEMRQTDTHSSFIFWMHGLNYHIPFGLCFGLGCNVNKQSAAESAIIEGLRHILYKVSQNNFTNINVQQFQVECDKASTASKDILELHDLLATNVDYFQQISNLFFNLQSPDQNIPEINYSKRIAVQEISWPQSTAHFPFYGAYAQSSSIQNLYFGQTEEAKVNFKRLTEFTNKEVTWQMIQKTPHPMN